MAVEIMANKPPLEILAEATSNAGRKKNSTERIIVLKEAIQSCHAKWEMHKETWLKQLIPHLTLWVTRKYGDTTYRTGQDFLVRRCACSYLTVKIENDQCKHHL